jgi:tetratricopeptide (TPR) repeat protein
MTLGENGNIGRTQTFCLLLFGFNIVAFYALLRNIYGRNLYVFIGTAIFSLNPTMVSSVQFLSACNNQISLFFLLLYLQFGLRFTQTSGYRSERRSLVYFAICLTCLSLSLIGYEAAVTGAGILCIMLIGLKGINVVMQRRVQVCLFSSFLLTASYLGIRALAGAKNYFTSPSLPPDSSQLDLILRAPYYTWQHFVLWFWPWGHGGTLIVDDPSSQFIAGIVGWSILLMLMFFLLYGLFTSYKLIAAGALNFLGAMIPLSNYLGFANGPICNYYLLLPGIGLAVLAAELFKRMLSINNKSIQILTLVCLACYLTGYGFETYMRVEHWSSSEKLLKLSLKNYPNNYVHLRDAAIVALKNDDEKTGRAYIEKALQFAPWKAATADVLAYYYQKRGRPDDALSWLLEYHAQVEPDPWLTLMRKGEVLIELSRYDAAYEMVPVLLVDTLTNEETCRLYLNLAVPSLLSYGRREEARHILETLELTPDLKGRWSQLREDLLKISE